MESNSSTAYERHGKLVSSGAPHSCQVLNGSWRRSPDQPYIRDRPHYIRDCQLTGAKTVLHIFYNGTKWRIATGIGNEDFVVVLGEADSAAHHPITVKPLVCWKLIRDDDSEPVELCPEFEFSPECRSLTGQSTQEQPFLMEELGMDFFMRDKLQTRLVYWFQCPVTGQVFHSAAKRQQHAGRENPGSRYCHLCKRCFSANNFHSQHLKNRHRPGKPLDVRVELTRHPGEVALRWALPSEGEKQLRTQFRIKCSTDNGRVVQELESAKNGCNIELPTGHSYSFQVQAQSVAGDSEWSLPSEQICVPPQSPAGPGLFDAVPSVSPFKKAVLMNFSNVDAPHNENKLEELLPSYLPRDELHAAVAAGVEPSSSSKHVQAEPAARKRYRSGTCKIDALHNEDKEPSTDAESQLRVLYEKLDGPTAPAEMEDFKLDAPPAPAEMEDFKLDGPPASAEMDFTGYGLEHADGLEQANWPSAEDDPIVSSSLMNGSFMASSPALINGSFMARSCALVEPIDAAWPMNDDAAWLMSPHVSPVETA